MRLRVEGIVTERTNGCRTGGGWRQVPIILITSPANVAARELVAELGAAIVDKPPDMDDLCTIVAHLLSRRQVD